MLQQIQAGSMLWPATWS